MMDKQSFIAECTRQMANITDPKRQSSNRCRKNGTAWQNRIHRAVMKRKLKEQEAREDAKL